MATNPYKIKDREETIATAMNALKGAGNGNKIETPTVAGAGKFVNAGDKIETPTVAGVTVKNDYTDAIMNDLQNGSNDQPEQTYTDDDIYEYLRSASAKELVDSNIQLAVARQQAQKNLQASLASSGLAGSGYGATAGVGINSAYLRGLADNEANYATNINQINMQEAQAKKEEEAIAKQEASNSVLAVYEAVQNATNDEQIKQALALGNITYENGVLGGEGYDNLTDEQKRYLQYYINLTKSYNETPLDLTLGAQENGINSDTEQAYNSLVWFSTNAPMKEGLVVELQGVSGRKTYVMYSNGRWVMSNANAYNAAKEGDKSTIYGYGPGAQVTGYFANYR